jgi:hypothetical protein
LSWAKGHGATRIVQIGLRLARELLDAPIPDTALIPGELDGNSLYLTRRLQARLLSFPPLPEPEGEFPWHSVFYKSMQRFRDRARWVYEIILLPGELEWGLLPMPATLAPLYFPVRLVRLGWKYIQKSLLARHRIGKEQREKNDEQAA